MQVAKAGRVEFSLIPGRQLITGLRLIIRAKGLGADDGSIDSLWVPGAFELPVIAAKAAPVTLMTPSSVWEQ